MAYCENGMKISLNYYVSILIKSQYEIKAGSFLKHDINDYINYTKY